MKLTNFKTVVLMLLASAMFVLSGCGSSGTPSEHDLVGGSSLTQAPQAPYVITAYQGSTAVLHSHVDTPNGTHQWTQVSGPTVTIGTPTSPTATVVVPTSATTPIVIHHTHTINGQTITTAHTITPIPATSALSLKVSKGEKVIQGAIASLHASVSGGTAPYTYVWTQTFGTTVTLDETHPSAPTFTVPRDAAFQTETFKFKVRVLDSAGAEITSKEETINAVAHLLDIDAPTTLADVELEIVKIPYDPANLHQVSSGRMFITNAFPGETYKWDIIELSGKKPDLINPRVTSTEYIDKNGVFKAFGILKFEVADFTNEPDTGHKYTLQMTVTDSKGTRKGRADTAVTIYRISKP